MEQSEFLNDCVRLILEIYKSSRYVDANLLATDNVLMIGHSMGGIAVRAMFLHDNFTPNSVRAIVTLATPHSGPVVPVDRTLVQIYRRVHEYWQRGENAALADVSIISILPGANDKLINSESGMLQDLPPSLAKLVFWTSSIPTVWTCPDHNRIIQCRSISLALADILYAHHEADGRLKAPPERIRAVARLLRFSISDTLHTLPVHTSPGDIIPRTPTTSVALNNSAWMKVEHLSTLILNGVDSSSPAPTTTQIDLVTNLVFGVDFSIEVLCELCDAQTAVWPVRTRYTRLLPYSSDDFDSLVHISLGLDFDLALPGPPAARKRPRVLVRVRPADPAAPSPAVPYPFYISKAMVGKAGLLAARKSTGQSDHATEPFLKIWGQEGKAYDFPGVLWRDLAWGPVSWQIPRNVSGYFAVSFPDLTTGWPLYHLALSGQDAHKDVVVVSRCRATGEEQWFYRQSDVFIRLHGLDSPKGVDFEFWLPGMYHLTPITAELSLEVWGSLAQIFRRCLSFSLPVAFALSLQALSMSWAEPSSPHLLSMIVRPQCLLRVAATTLAIELGHRLVAWASLQIVPKSSPLHTFPGKTLQDVLLGTDSANAFAPVFVLLSGSFFILTLIGANIAANVLHRLLHTLRPARTQAYEAIPKPHQSSRLGLGVLVLFCFLAPFHYAFLVVFMMMLVHCVKVELGGAPCGETQRVFFLHVLLVLAILQLINGAPLLVWIKNVYVGWLSTKDHDPVSVLPLGLLVFAVRSGRFTPEAFSQYRAARLPSPANPRVDDRQGRAPFSGSPASTSSGTPWRSALDTHTSCTITPTLRRLCCC